jgi:hypothetical protein
MSKRKKPKTSPIIELIALIIQTIVVLCVRLIVFAYDIITFYTSEYKIKSGYSFIKTYFDKGNYGEFKLYRKVIRVFGKSSVMTNIYLENENTEHTEIDVLAISNKSIYVFEMKNYSGYIYGSQKDKYWTQVLNKWTKNKFYNPLRQNYAHAKAVENYLMIDYSVITPIVVFSNRSKLSKINVDKNTNAFQFRDALKFVKRNEKRGIDMIDDVAKTDYILKLLDRCHMPEEVRLKHIDDVKQLISNQE